MLAHLHNFDKMKAQPYNLGKTLNFKLLYTNKDTIINTTFENKGVGHLHSFKFIKIKKINHIVQSQTLDIF